MDAMEFDGKDLDDALAAAGAALGRPPSELDFEVLEGGRKGVFGLGARLVRIRVAVSGGSTIPAAGSSPADPASPPRAAPAVAPRRPSSRPNGTEADPADRDAVRSGSPRLFPGRPAAESAPAVVLSRILDLMGFDLEVAESRNDHGLELELDGPDRKRLTAREGEVIVALEFLLNRMARRSWPDESVVHVSCAGFHPDRDDELVHLVREVAAQVAASGRPKRLHPMNPYERRVVHVTVREIAGLTTVSEGDGFLKRIRVEKIAP